MLCFRIGIGNIFVISGSDGIFPAATPKVPSGFFPDGHGPSNGQDLQRQAVGSQGGRG